MTLRPSDILAEPCPLCGAVPGQSCRVGAVGMWVHTARAAHAELVRAQKVGTQATALAAAVVR